jgi:inner membrane protein
METVVQKAEKIGQSTTVKALIIAVMSLLLLIPESMIENLIRERELRSIETVEKINEKWSNYCNWRRKDYRSRDCGWRASGIWG